MKIPQHPRCFAFCAALQFTAKRRFLFFGLFRVEDVLVHALESLLNAAERGGKVHAHVAGAVESAAVLNRNAHIPAGLENVVNSLAVRLAPLRAVNKEHIGALGLGNLNALKVIPDVITGKVHVAAENFNELIQPLVTLGLVGTDERVHGQHVHAVVVGQAGLLAHAVMPPLVVNDVIAAHEAGQVEGLGGGIERCGALTRILGNGLRGSVLVAGEDQVGPDLIRDDENVVLLEEFHGLLDLLTLPDAAAGVVRVAEDGSMDVLGFELFFHVRKVHTPHALLVLHQRREHHVVAVVAKATGEADIGGGVQQHLVALAANAVERRDHAAEHAVFIADVLLRQTGDAIALFLPCDNSIVVFITSAEITEGVMLHARGDRLGDGGNRGEVHVCNPHGDGVKALLRCAGRAAALAQTVNRNRVHPVTIHDGCEIVFHKLSSSYM